MKINKFLILAVASGAGVLASAVLAFKAGTKASEILAEQDPDGEMTLVQKAKVVAPTVLPAAGAVALTGAGIVAQFTGREREFRKVSNMLETANQRKEQVKKNFTKYRDTLTELEGKEKDVAVVAKAAQPTILPDGDDGELKHRWKIDWLGEGKEIYLDASMLEIQQGVERVNRILVDPYFPSEHTFEPRVSDFLKAIGHEEYCNTDTDEAGWNIETLNAECDACWVDFDMMRTIEPDGKIIYELIPVWYPNFSISQYVREAEARGII